MMDRNLLETVATAVHARDELPPEALLHGPQLRQKPLDDFLAGKDKGAARVVDGNVEHGLVKQVEQSRASAAQGRVGAIDPPAQQHVGVVARVPEVPKVLGIAL